MESGKQAAAMEGFCLIGERIRDSNLK